MRREDAIRLGWAGIGVSKLAQLERDKITQEELERIRKGIRPGDHVTWKVYTYPKEYLGGSRYPVVRKRLTVTGMLPAFSYGGREKWPDVLYDLCGDGDGEEE